MSPAPTTIHDAITSHTQADNVLNALSSSDELEHNMYNDNGLELGALMMDTIENVDISDSEQPPTLTLESVQQSTTLSAPSTPTGERDPPVIFRKNLPNAAPSTANESVTLPVLEKHYENNHTNTTDNHGLFGSFFGCIKPFLSAVNKITESVSYSKDKPKASDEWEIPIDKIVNNLEFIATGIEGSVFRGKLGNQDIACKRVKTKEDTNVKHLKKLNHPNVIKFLGVSISAPLFYVIMELCPHGSLYQVLKNRRDINSGTKPTQAVDWAKQIASGVEYLHSNKIVHRDLKSPNILFFDKHTLKISDFGTSKQLSNQRDQIMSFNGTSAWMAPEVIRHELCSEKVDVWSFGVVLWEILTCRVPYGNIDPNAVMWGVGKGSLTLPIPTSTPDGLRILMKICWEQKQTNRPSFQQIIRHLDIAKPHVALFEQEQEYAELTRIWSVEIKENLAELSAIDMTLTDAMTNDELLKKRQEELQHIAYIREHYQKKLQEVSALYIELRSLMMQLQQRENYIKQKERSLNINNKKQTINKINEARKKSLEMIKRATSNLNDPTYLLSQKKQTSNKFRNSSTNIGTTNDLTDAPNKAIDNSALNNAETSNTRTIQRRVKASGHHRTNSKGSTISWTPPSLTAIEDQEKRRASTIHTNNIQEESFTKDAIPDSSADNKTTIENVQPPVPSISANIDSKSNLNKRRLDPNTLQLDLQNPMILSMTSYERIVKSNSLAPRKSSSSGQDEDDIQHNTFPRQRRRRYPNLYHSKSNSPASLTTPTNHQSQTNHKNTRNVMLQSPSSAILDRNFEVKPIKHADFTSSEEGEVEEVHSDGYVLDDEKHRAKHHHSYGIFSSESEISGEKQNKSKFKTPNNFSDEGGQVSDDRPGSRGSMLNSD